MNVHSVSRYEDTPSAADGFPHTLLGLFARLVVEGQVTVAAALDEGAKRAPDDRHEDLGTDVLEDLLGGRVGDELARGPEQEELGFPAPRVEVRRVMMELEE